MYILNRGGGAESFVQYTVFVTYTVQKRYENSLHEMEHANMIWARYDNIDIYNSI